jgi:hypothetical protein
MKLHRSCDFTPDGTGLVCRQARWAGIAGVLVFGGACSACTVFLWWFGAWSIFWIGSGLFTLLLGALFVGDVRARFRPTNWLLWIRRDKLLVHFRCYQDQTPLDTVGIIELDYAEILEVRRHIERYTTPNSDGGSVSHKLTSIEIQLAERADGGLESALAESRRREQPWRTHLGFIRGRSGLTTFSLTLPMADVIRIAWRGGGGHWVTPSVRRVLDALSAHVKIGDGVREDRDDWRKLSDAELDDQILAFIRTGNRLEAKQLLVRRRGFTLTEAHKFVEELSQRA